MATIVRFEVAEVGPVYIDPFEVITAQDVELQGGKAGCVLLFRNNHELRTTLDITADEAFAVFEKAGVTIIRA